MRRQEYEIYDIITKQRIDKSKIVPGKSYIICYLNDKWKIRKVTFDENGEIKTEEYIRLGDKQQEIKDTIVNILEMKGNTSIQVEYSKNMDIQDGATRVEIGLPIYNVKYQDLNGVGQERMLDADTLKDVLTFDTNHNKHITIKDKVIKDAPINIQTNALNGEPELVTVNWNNVERMGGETSISNGNVIFNVNKDGEMRTYDLRTAEGVSGLKDYMEKETVREKE